MTWKATVFTLFPEMFPGPLGISLLGKALQNKLWQLDVHDIRDGKIRRLSTYFDSASLLQQLGVMPEAGAAAKT